MAGAPFTYWPAPHWSAVAQNDYRWPKAAHYKMVAGTDGIETDDEQWCYWAGQICVSVIRIASGGQQQRGRECAHRLPIRKVLFDDEPLRTDPQRGVATRDDAPPPTSALLLAVSP